MSGSVGFTAGREGKRAILARLISDLEAASSHEDLETRFQAALETLRGAHGGMWSTGYRRAADKLQEHGLRPQGMALCDAAPLGHLVPRFDTRTRRLHVAGQNYRVGNGGNSTGVRYAWHAADEWAKAVLAENGVEPVVAKAMLEWWPRYPHRALAALERASPLVGGGQ